MAKHMTLAESLAHMMSEYIDGAKRMAPEWRPDHEQLRSLFERRLSRYISADTISGVISEDASLHNGALNVGHLAVKIASICEGRHGGYPPTSI